MGNKPESFSDYLIRIFNNIGKPLPGPEKGANGKYILPASYSTGTPKKRGLSDKTKQRIQDPEVVEMFYEYIMESRQLRTAMTLYLLDQRAEAILHISRPQANVRIPYASRKRKHMSDWSPDDYIKLRKCGKFARDVRYPASIPQAIVDRCSIQVLGRLGQLDEELLMNGVRYKDHLKLISRKRAKMWTESIRKLYPDHLKFVEGYLRDDATSYDSEVPDIIAQGRYGKDNWTPFPLWIDANATIAELKKDFCKLLTVFENKRIREEKEPFPKSKPGNKSAGPGLPSPAAALTALRMWRIKKIMDQMHVTGNICDVFDMSQSPDADGGITTASINRGAKQAEHCFAVLEGRSK